MTERHWCTCGGALTVTSDEATVRSVVRWFWAWHTTRPSGPKHQATDRRTAARARRRAERAQKRGQAGTPEETPAGHSARQARSQRDFLDRRQR